MAVIALGVFLVVVGLATYGASRLREGRSSRFLTPTEVERAIEESTD